MQEPIPKLLSPSDAFLLLELIDNCAHCRSNKGLEAIINKLKQLLHFRCMAITHVNISEFLNGEKNSFQGNDFEFPRGFLERYFSQDLFRIDVPILVFLKTSELQNWKESIKLNNDGVPTAVDEELKDYGLCDGWVYGTRDIKGIKTTIISLGTEYSQNSNRNKDIIRLSTPHIAEAYKRILKIQNFNKYHLTKRELEMLNWLKEGKTSWEISMILNISERCVNFHINNAKTKLNSVNRAQAVAVALGENLIVL